ncbi:acylneuraminate cytidylyltransferase family protein [uncultured Flavobacterium sp.]|uniref:acylneuraminate cytidylyltransferase family protein n=1 Tax=uncultured Flavobacterium sp. TaxID=165435 RepID=UPI0025D4AE9E|nr:acylneuraminate cytidylyltransferase family protein [uncultured Flavobacterium sp.]
MRILAIIPVRGGSKGVPGKNIKLLDGKPLLAYTAEVAFASNLLTEVIVSTEDEQISEIAKGLGAKVPFFRPMSLAEDNTPTVDVVIHALKWYESQSVFFDAVCLLQVTCPFRTVEFLNKAIERFVEKDTDSLVSVLKVPHVYNPHWTFEEDHEGNLKNTAGDSQIISRRQELPTAYHRDGSVYITKSKVLLKEHSLYGKSIAFIESDPESYVNIDTLADWKKAEEIIQQKMK